MSFDDAIASKETAVTERLKAKDKGHIQDLAGQPAVSAFM